MRRWTVTTLLVAVLAALTVVPAAAQQAAPSCAPVALFVVPATGETSATADPATPVGLQAGLATPLAQRWGGRLHVEYLPYPATLDRPPYPVSEARGIATLVHVTTDYAARCPHTRLALLGYSQGADIVSDLVHRASRGTIALAPDRIATAVMLGSPRRDPSGANLVPAPGHGILGSRPTRELAVYGPRVYEVCVPDDPICATRTLDIGRFREGLASGAHHGYARYFDTLGHSFDDLISSSPEAP